MDCPTCEAMVDAYVDGELTASESAVFERALEACPECRPRLRAPARARRRRSLPGVPAAARGRADDERPAARAASRAGARSPAGQDRARAADDCRRPPGA